MYDLVPYDVYCDRVVAQIPVLKYTIFDRVDLL
jgi:hypothetical protein